MKRTVLDIILGFFVILVPLTVSTLIYWADPDLIDPLTVFMITVGICAFIAEIILKKTK